MPQSAKFTHRIPIHSLSDCIDEEVTIGGFIASKRHHGKVIFLDIRDSTGEVQCVTTANQAFFPDASEAKEQSSLIVTGKVARRPEHMATDAPNGQIEVQLTDVSIITHAKDFPWGSQSSHDVNEELRMRYRYLDLRDERMKQNLKLRSNVLHFVRNYLINKDFTDIETPYITKGTPEGAREYIVPSRLHPGKFYALPQSPQQFKQLLMVAGFDRYFQIARCFRDEDSRGDRQPEFTQLDVEMSFVDKEMMLNFIEDLFIAIVKQVTPSKHLQQIPFPRLTYREAMEKYGTDKPDLRKDPKDHNELAFCWVTDQPLFEFSSTEKKLVAVHHLFTRPKEGNEALLDTEPESATADSYDLVLNGYEVVGGSIRIHEPELQRKIFRILSINDKEARSRFGHMLEAFAYGAPPHGGFASGIDRFIMVLAGESSIREVIAFPKTGDGRDLMMDAPSPVAPEQLKESHISIDASK